MSKNNYKLLLLFPHYGNVNQAASLRSSQIGTFFAKKGHKVTVFAPGVDMRTEIDLPEVKGKWYADIVIDGVRIIYLKCINKFRRSALRRLLFEVFFAFYVALFMFKIKKPNIIIGSYPPAVLPSIGLIASKVLRVPFIFEVRDLMADALVANRYVKSDAFIRIAQWIENQLYKRCNRIVTVSEGIKKAIVAKGIDEAKITVVKNGYEPQVFDNVDYSFDPRQKYGWQDAFVVIYAGGLTQSYDIKTLLYASKMTIQTPNLRYVILGHGEKKAEYMEFCSRHSLHNVQFIDPVPRKMIPSILSKANVGVHLFPDNPLWNYVLGNKPFDYMGSGIPMIYSGDGDTADLVRESGGGFVVHPERPHELVEKIYWLKNNPEQCKAMGEKARSYVQDNCNRLVLLEEFEELIQSIQV
jgi:glycosyltransferase involved in cell wall biosynthesis